MESSDLSDGNPDLATSSKLPKSIYLLVFVSAIGGFLFGYDTGVVSGAMLLIREEFKLTNIWHEIIVSATIGAAWLFSLVAGPAADWLGRKMVIIGSSIVFTLGAILMAASPDKEILLVGRIIVGMGIGFASMCVPVYLSEISPSAIRGQLIVTNNIFITAGQFVAAIICGAFSSVSSGWRYMLGLAAVPSIVQFIAFLFCPESPRWLIQHKKLAEASAMLTKYRPKGAKIEEEIDIIKETCENQTASSTGLGAIFREDSVRRALIVGCLLQLFQQISGINTVMYYSASIITMAGVHDDQTAIWLAALVAFFNFSFTFVGLWLVERVGRRSLTLGSLGGTVFALLLLALSFHLVYLDSPEVGDTNANETTCSKYSSCSSCTRDSDCGFCFLDNDKSSNASYCLEADHDEYNEISLIGICLDPKDDVVFAFDWCPSDIAWLSIVSLCLYLCFFAPGMGPMPWAINSEIYPTWARAQCTSLATSINWASNLVVSLTFLSLTEAITKHGTFYFYMILALIGFIIFFVILPETKGIPLEKMEKVFQRPLLKSTPWKRNKSNRFLLADSYGTMPT